jgi:hypothetical protein
MRPSMPPRLGAVDTQQIRDDLKSGAMWLIAHTSLRLLLHV